MKPAAPDDIDFGISVAALEACASEPIRTPGAIQPFGALLVIDGPELTVSQCSANCEETLGVGPEGVVGRPLTSFVTGSPHGTLAEALHAPNGSLVPIELTTPRGRFDAYVRRAAGRTLLEVLSIDEPSSHVFTALAARRLSRLTGQVSGATTTLEFCQAVAEQARELTQYDRVMVYRFDSANRGEVIAESRREDLEPYLGLWYPASDIPAQARALYLESRVRALGDVGYRPVPMVPSAPTPLDMSGCILRSSSPIHCQYLHNMGVRATLVVSIIVQERLWGLLSCHHMEPKWPSFDMRMACDLLSELISVEIASKEASDRAVAQMRSAEKHLEIVRLVASEDDWVDCLLSPEVDLASLTRASGAAVTRGDQVWTVGETPTPDQVRQITSWLTRETRERELATDSLERLAPALAPLSPVASGLLAVEIARRDRSFIIWFRPERTRTVRWAGDPRSGLEGRGGAARLTPRRSFEAWVGEVRGTALPWSEPDRLAASALRTTIVGIVLDMMAIRQALTSLELLRIRRAVEDSGEPIAVADAAGMPSFVNRAFEALLSYDLEAVRAAGSIEACIARPQHARAIEEALRGAAHSYRGDLAVHDASGTAIPVTCSVDLIRGEGGEQAGYVYVLVDLRARIKAEEERRQLEAQVQRTQRLESLGLMAGGIAHDFNNLLTGILGYSSLALRELGPNNAVVRAHLEQIEAASLRAADLTRQMLAYSGNAPFVLQPVDLNRLVEEIAHLLRTTIARSAQLTLDLADSLPPFVGDATQIRQVLMNLLLNASDALGDRGGVITVRTGSLRVQADDVHAFEGPPLVQGDYLFMEVIDTGVGMDPDTLGRIFDPFFTTKFTGRGLGLAAVQGIVRAHAGGLVVKSEVGRGSTFRLLLPASPGTQVEVEPSPAEATPAQPPHRTILVIDDEPAPRAVAAAVLEKAGYSVLSARDGPAGLELFRSRLGDIDGVLLDLTMPGMGGADVLREIRKLDADVPVVITSGFSEEYARDQVRRGAAAGFLHKPYRADDLTRIVESALSGAPRRKRPEADARR